MKKKKIEIDRYTAKFKNADPATQCSVNYRRDNWTD